MKNHRMSMKPCSSWDQRYDNNSCNIIIGWGATKLN